MPKDNISVTRRSVLGAAGATLSLATVPALGAANRSRQEEFRDLVETANQILAETGDAEKAYKYLRARGVGVTSRSRTYQLPSSSTVSTNGNETTVVSPNSFPRSSLNITLSLYSSTGGIDCAKDEYPYYALLSWSSDDWNESEGGSEPKDVAGIYYNDSNWWEMPGSVSSATRTSNNVTYANASYNSNGIAFEVDDSAIENSGSSGWYAGMYLNPTGSYAPNQRLIRGEYIHNWSTVDSSIESISLGIPAGFSVSYSIETETHDWSTTTEEDNDTFLRVYQEDAAICR